MNDFFQLKEILNLKRKNESLFEGVSLDIGTYNVFGGQVVSQAISAALETVDDKQLHSLHSYFISPGNKKEPIDFEVETIKEGRSFDTKRITASQGDKDIFIMSASFQSFEKGLDYQEKMPEVVGPEGLQTLAQIYDEYNVHNFPKWGVFNENGAFTFKPVDAFDPFNHGTRPAEIAVWLKPNTQDHIEASLSFKQMLIAYVSDFNLLVVSLLPHGISMLSTPMQMASLDHSIWFHNEPNLNDYMLYTVDCHVTTGGRGLCNGRIYNRDGSLVATILQEGLIRILEK